MGFRITYLPVDEHGHISLDDLKAQLDQDTILVSTMYVNNEIGAVEPISEIGELVKDYNEQILFHVDAIQAYGKYRIFPEKLHIDMLSVSGHKIHGPKGSGFLYIHEKAKVRPLIYGGGQQRGMRSGTENVPGIAGLGIAAMEAYTDFERKVDSMRACKKRLMEGLSGIEGAHILSLQEEAPQIVSCSFEGVRSEVFLHALEEKGVYVSSGSACSSNKKTPVSTVLQEIHLSPQRQDSTLRFSFCDTTSLEEIDYALSCIRELYPVLKRYMRR